MSDSVLGVYRRLVREARTFPIGPVGRKIQYNVRQLFEHHKEERRPEHLERLREDCEAALRIIAWLRCLPEVCCTRPSHPFTHSV